MSFSGMLKTWPNHALQRRAWHFDCHEYYHVTGFGHISLRRLWLSLGR